MDYEYDNLSRNVWITIMDIYLLIYDNCMDIYWIFNGIFYDKLLVVYYITIMNDILY